MPVFFIHTAIILDPSVDGIEGGNTYDRETATWSVTFDYGTVSGIASCNDISGSGYGKTYSGNQNNITQGYQEDQMNCWCRMTTPVRSAWVYRYECSSASECASYCAYYCVDYVQTSSNFRIGMFGSAGNWRRNIPIKNGYNDYRGTSVPRFNYNGHYLGSVCGGGN